MPKICIVIFEYTLYNVIKFREKPKDREDYISILEFP